MNKEHPKPTIVRLYAKHRRIIKSIKRGLKLYSDAEVVRRALENLAEQKFPRGIPTSELRKMLEVTD